MKKQRDDFQMLPQKKRRMEGGGRKANLLDVEDELLVWIDQMCAENQKVTWSSIQQKALSIICGHGEASTCNFTSSRGWLKKFCQ